MESTFLFGPNLLSPSRDVHLNLHGDLSVQSARRICQFVCLSAPSLSLFLPNKSVFPYESRVCTPGETTFPRHHTALPYLELHPTGLSRQRGRSGQEVSAEHSAPTAPDIHSPPQTKHLKASNPVSRSLRESSLLSRKTR